MMRRPGGAEFAPGAYVFPGGSLHGEDAGFEDQLRAAGDRELFEELGILLARTPHRFASNADCRRLRSLLEAGVAWPQALKRLNLTLALDRLAFLARWITPLPVKRRFDTSFYVARLPAGQREHPQPDEVTDWLWIRPRDALERLDLVFATRGVLGMVAEEPDAAALVRKLRRRRPGPVVMPRIERRPGGGFEPVAELYDPETLEPLADRWGRAGSRKRVNGVP